MQYSKWANGSSELESPMNGMVERKTVKPKAVEEFRTSVEVVEKLYEVGKNKFYQSCGSSQS